MEVDGPLLEHHSVARPYCCGAIQSAGRDRHRESHVVYNETGTELAANAKGNTKVGCLTEYLSLHVCGQSIGQPSSRPQRTKPDVLHIHKVTHLANGLLSYGKIHP